MGLVNLPASKKIFFVRERSQSFSGPEAKTSFKVAERDQLELCKK